MCQKVTLNCLKLVFVLKLILVLQGQLLKSCFAGQETALTAIKHLSLQKISTSIHENHHLELQHGFP
jgi:hypothetical protein